MEGREMEVEGEREERRGEERRGKESNERL
jgi:hypothetical protein